MKTRTYRQFFRIVTAEVSFWYKDHSTANPLGVQPDPNITKIVVGNKFSEEGVKIVKTDQDLVAKNEENDGEPVKKSAKNSEKLKIRCEWYKIHSGECSGGLSDGEIEEDESD